MKKLIKLKFLGIVLAFIFCFLIHFLYEKSPCFITSIIAPVNESIWEHMKILFGSILLSGVIQKIIVKIKKLPYKNVCISNIIASVTSIPIFLVMFLPVYKAIGKSLPITIIIMLIVIIISQLITIPIVMSNKDLRLENISIIFAILIYVIFGLLTYNPPKNDLFIDPLTNTYGIKK